MTNKSGLTGISFMQSPVIPGSTWGCIDWEYKIATQEEKEMCILSSPLLSHCHFVFPYNEDV